MVRPQPYGGGDTGTIGAQFCLVFFALSLSACADHPSLSTGAPPPPSFDLAAAAPLNSMPSTPNTEELQSAGLITPETVPMAPVRYMGAQMGGSAMARQPGFNTSFSPSLALASASSHDCTFTDRFDRKTTLAYNFDENHSLGLKMGFNNHSGGMEMSHALLEFHYRFNSVKSPMAPDKTEKCRYASHWQGLVGSGYNELMLRNTNTIWGEARDRGLDFWH